MCSPFCSTSKGMLAIFEILQKVVSDVRAGVQGQSSQSNRSPFFYSREKSGNFQNSAKSNERWAGGRAGRATLARRNNLLVS